MLIIFVWFFFCAYLVLLTIVYKRCSKIYLLKLIVLSGQIDNIGGCVFFIEDCKSMVVTFESYKTHIKFEKLIRMGKQSNVRFGINRFLSRSRWIHWDLKITFNDLF